METAEPLVRRAQAGDADAFTQLIARYERTALALAYSLTQNAAQASDVVQEAFLRAWQRLGSLQEPAKFGGWFGRIVRNLAMDSIRRGPRSTDSIEDGFAVPATSRSDSNPEHALAMRETGRCVNEALGTLDELSRTAIVLRYYQDLSSKQIGELLDLSPAAVDMRLSRARGQLRDALAWMNESDENEQTCAGGLGAR